MGTSLQSSIDNPRARIDDIGQGQRPESPAIRYDLGDAERISGRSSRVVPSPLSLSRKPGQRNSLGLTVLAIVVGGHLAVLNWLATSRATPPFRKSPVMEVSLIDIVPVKPMRGVARSTGKALPSISSPRFGTGLGRATLSRAPNVDKVGPSSPPSPSVESWRVESGRFGANSRLSAAISRSLQRREACQRGEAEDPDCWQTSREFAPDRTRGSMVETRTVSPQGQTQDFCVGSNFGTGCAGDTTWTLYRRQF